MRFSMVRLSTTVASAHQVVSLFIIHHGVFISFLDCSGPCETFLHKQAFFWKQRFQETFLTLWRFEDLAGMDVEPYCVEDTTAASNWVSSRDDVSKTRAQQAVATANKLVCSDDLGSSAEKNSVCTSDKNLETWFSRWQRWIQNSPLHELQLLLTEKISQQFMTNIYIFICKVVSLCIQWFGDANTHCRASRDPGRSASAHQIWFFCGRRLPLIEDLRNRGTNVSFTTWTTKLWQIQGFSLASLNWEEMSHYQEGEDFVFVAVTNTMAYNIQGHALHSWCEIAWQNHEDTYIHGSIARSVRLGGRLLLTRWKLLISCSSMKLNKQV